MNPDQRDALNHLLNLVEEQIDYDLRRVPCRRTALMAAAVLEVDRLFPNPEEPCQDQNSPPVPMGPRMPTPTTA